MVDKLNNKQFRTPYLYMFSVIFIALYSNRLILCAFNFAKHSSVYAVTTPFSDQYFKPACFPQYMFRSDFHQLSMFLLVLHVFFCLRFSIYKLPVNQSSSIFKTRSHHLNCLFILFFFKVSIKFLTVDYFHSRYCRTSSYIIPTEIRKKKNNLK